MTTCFLFLFVRFGVIVYPSSVPNEKDKRYEGEFFEGKMCGYGKMRFALLLFQSLCFSSENALDQMTLTGQQLCGNRQLR